MLRVLVCFVARKITQRPFRNLERQGPLTLEERLTRHQLEPVLILHSVFRRDLGLQQNAAISILKKVVGESGARFIQYAIKNPEEKVWKSMGVDEKNAFARQGLKQFFNLVASITVERPFDFAFDVKKCHFVALTHELGRSELAPLFCAADQVLFSRPELKILMTREETLAQGHPRCAFRFTWGDPVDK